MNNAIVASFKEFNILTIRLPLSGAIHHTRVPSFCGHSSIKMTVNYINANRGNKLYKSRSSHIFPALAFIKSDNKNREIKRGRERERLQ